MRLEPDEDQKVLFEEQAYYLEYVKFNSPSEHYVGKKRYDAEIQLVHKNQHGDFLIISTLVLEGAKSTTIKEVIERLNNPRLSKTLLGWTPLNLIPKTRKFYRYSGSLSSPPCTEGSTWVIFLEGVQFSGKQLDSLEKIYGRNNRPIQDLGNRIPLKSR